MKGDFTRQTFDRRKHFSEVLFQQGRVQLDADLNEQQDILRDSARTEARDVIGWAGVPKYGGGFEIAVTDQGEDLTISPGRIYVDGLMCTAESPSVGVESLDKKSVTVAQWPEQKFEKTDWFQLKTDGGLVWTRRAAKLDAGKRTIEFEPELKPSDLNKVPDPTKVTLQLLPSYRRQPDLPQVAEPTDGTHLVYLDVWERLITPFDDPAIREKGLGGPDTAARAKVVWQVKLEETEESAACGQFGPDWKPKAAAADGKLNVRTAPVPPTKDPCLLPGQSGYRGLENQLYRVEIHQGGKIGQDKVTFKWSRDNGSVVTGIDKISGSTLTVSGLGPDDVHGFSDNQWVEIVDDATELSRQSGPLVQIKTADRTTDTIVLKSTPLTLPTSIDEKLHYKLRRWDCEGACKAEIPTTNDGWIALEKSVEVKFSAGAVYRAGDYWLIPARTAAGSETGSLEWPQDADGTTIAQLPHGIQHHYAPLALVEVQKGKFQVPLLSDCRNPFPPLIEVGEGESAKGAACCTFAVGDGVRTHGDFDDIEDALLHIPEGGGELCLLPGLHQVNALIRGRYNIRIKGCGLRTKVVPRPSNPDDPVFVVAGSSLILFSDLCVASFEGVGIAVEDDESRPAREIRIQNSYLLGYRAAVHVQEGFQVAIRNNYIRVLDRREGGVAVYLAATDSVIEGNDIAVTRAFEESPNVEIPGPEGGGHFNPQDDCAEFERLYRDRTAQIDLTNRIFTRGRALDTKLLLQVAFTGRAEGGIQVAAGSERIRIRDNRIRGGTGNGITLGGWDPLNPAAEEETDESTQPEKSFNHPGGFFVGVMRKGATPVPGTAVRVMSDTTQQTYTSVTDQAGSFQLGEIAAGQYSIGILSPGASVGDVSTDDEGNTVISVEEKPPTGGRQLLKSVAFLREILIEDNRIFQMGLSGIGTCAFTNRKKATTDRAAFTQNRNPILRILRLWGNPILDLTIARNHVAGCLNTDVNEDLRVQGAGKGLGGISLGFCEDLSIIENRIEHNGVAPLPVSAIFVGYGEHVEISLNRIQQNGAVPLGFVGEKAAGFFRGGIFVLLGSCLFDPEATENQQYSTSLGQYAVRIHGNTVSQPIGRALALGALGPVSVQNNYFDSHACLPGWPNQIGGAVLILNLGRSPFGGGRTDWRTASLFGGMRAAQPARVSPSGAVQFCNNQSQIGAFNSSWLPHLILSLDDVCFEANQLRSSRAGSAPAANALILGVTLRATGNRFQEPQMQLAVSLISWARLMNTTAQNQGDHCIFALCPVASNLIKTPNQTLATDCNQVLGMIKEFVVKLKTGGKNQNG